MSPDYSLDALVKFLDYTAEKGLMKPNTANSRKRSALKILAILDDDEKRDLRQIDVDRTFKQFENLQGSEFKPASLQVFKSRLRSALTDFFNYAESPSTFKPSSPQRNTAPTRRRKRVKETPESSQEDLGGDAHLDADSEPQHSPHIVIPVPIRDGLTVKIHNMPADLTKHEAEKIAGIIKAYASTGN